MPRFGICPQHALHRPVLEYSLFTSEGLFRCYGRPQYFSGGGWATRHQHGSWVCEFKIRHPHYSEHSLGRINVEGRFECNTVVQYIAITTRLMKQNCFVWICSWDSVGIPEFTFRAAVSEAWSYGNHVCQDGNYRGKSSVVFRWPDGTLDYGYWNGPAIYLTC